MHYYVAGEPREKITRCRARVLQTSSRDVLFSKEKGLREFALPSTYFPELPIYGGLSPGAGRATSCWVQPFAELGGDLSSCFRERLRREVSRFYRKVRLLSRDSITSQKKGSLKRTRFNPQRLGRGSQYIPEATSVTAQPESTGRPTSQKRERGGTFQKKIPFENLPASLLRGGRLLGKYFR